MLKPLVSNWITMPTLHSWVTALFYPAVLGTALMVWLAPQVAGAAARADTHWAPVLIAYFALQFGDGIGRGATYDLRGLAADVSEMVVILVAFDLMHILDIGFVNLMPGLTLHMVLPAIFLIPVLARGTRLMVASSKPSITEGEWRPWTLTIMSGAAAVVSGVWPGSMEAAGFVAFILLLYFLFCIAPRTNDGGFWDRFCREAAPRSG